MDTIDYHSLIAFLEDNFVAFAAYFKDENAAEATVDALKEACGMD